MKKIMVLICVLALVATLMPSAYAAGELTLTVEDAEIEASGGTQSVTVPISVAGNTGGICGIFVKLSYDSKLRLTELRQGEALHTLVFTEANDFTQNPVPLLWDGIEAEAGDGVILYATFSVPADKNGSYRLSISAPEGSIYDNDLEDYTVKTESGVIRVSGAESATPSDESPAKNSGSSGRDSKDSTSFGGDPDTGDDDALARATDPANSGFYYVVITMTDAGEAEECRVAYYPDGSAENTAGEKRIDLRNISNATVKLLAAAGEGASDPKTLCYVVTTPDGRVNIQATNALNGI